MYTNIIKPTFDFLAAFIGLLLLSPIFIIVTIGLFFANSGQPFFFQVRPGKNEQLFKIIKFRTMNDRRDKEGNLLPDAQRLTAIGKFVRKTSLDELPQLINVLKGDMSLIGPRPLRVKYLTLYNEEQRKRHKIRPGITGWAQVNGRNTISWSRKFEYDVWYVDNLSVILDFKIMILTFKKVFKSEGVNQEGQATVQAFNGKN